MAAGSERKFLHIEANFPPRCLSAEYVFPLQDFPLPLVLVTTLKS